MLHLRARWYTTGQGRFASVDPFPGMAEQPYSQHPYAYALSNPVRWTDPSGACVAYGNTECALVTTWDDVTAMFPYMYARAPIEAAQAAAINGWVPRPHAVAEWAAW